VAVRAGVSLRYFVARRAINAIPVVIGILVFVFFLIELAPGDPVYMLIGEGGATEELITAYRHEFGLDKPLAERFMIFLWQTAQLNFGYSTAYRTPVSKIILDRLPNTVMLTVTAFVISVIVGIALGAYSASRPFSTRDTAIMSVSLIGYSIPGFWLGQLLVLALASSLGWFPVQGIMSMKTLGDPLSWNTVLDVAHHMVLPTIALATYLIALIARMTRVRMLEAMCENYVVTARMKGLPERVVFIRHGLRNALLPVITVIALQFGYQIIGGSVIIETVFSWPGLGRLVYDAILSRDIPIITGVFFLLSLSVVIVNLVADILYACFDPRIRYR